MPNNNNINLRSEEVQEILTQIPNKIIRWGNIVVFLIFVLLFFASYFIKYPDIIATQIIITTENPPEKLVAKTSGKIETILVNDKSNVLRNTPIAVIENAANYQDVFLLKSIVDTVSINKNNFQFYKLDNLQLGEIESYYAVFQKELSSEKLNKQLQPYKVEGNAQSIEVIQLKERLSLLESQKSINLNELELQKSDLNRYQLLFDKGIIASQELEKQKLNYLQAQKNYKNVLNSISQTHSSINEMNKNSRKTQINESIDNVSLERSSIQAFYQLKKAIKDWELNYVLSSSINGKVSFLQIWTENQTINAGETIFAVIPNDSKNFIGKVKAVAQNSGKIKLGQDVNIRLANYPDREYGIIKGKIKNISLTPDKEGNLLIDVSLPNGLKTSYNKKLYFNKK